MNGGKIVISGDTLQTPKAYLGRPLVRTLEMRPGSVWAITVTPEGCYIVLVSKGKTLEVWDLASGKILALFTADGLILACAVACDSRTIVAGDGSGRVHFLRLEGVFGGDT